MNFVRINFCPFEASSKEKIMTNSSARIFIKAAMKIPHFHHIMPKIYLEIYRLISILTNYKLRNKRICRAVKTYANPLISFV